jgi:agmatine deiminase
MVAEISRGEAVRIIVPSKEAGERVLEMLDEHGAYESSVRIFEVCSADVWVRDYGPIFARILDGGRLAGVKWRFNAWGGKYDELAKDDETGRMILKLSGAEPVVRSLVIEGGAVEVSGDGLVIATEQCLLNPARNPGASRRLLETELAQFLGARHVLWLRRGLVGDDTDGHVDVFCRFAPGGKILLAETRAGPNHDILEEAAATLTGYVDALGLPFSVVRVPMPPPVRVLGMTVPATYLNYYVTNAAVLLPVFGAREDEEAYSLLSECYPDRRVVGLRCPELFYGLGGPHCVTLHQPQGS